MDKICVTIPLKNEYLTTVRLTTGGVCALAEFDMDLAEDVKVCVTESLLILKRSGFAQAEVNFEIGETLKVSIVGKDKTANMEQSDADEISYALLDALIGGVTFEKDENGTATSVYFEV